MSQMYVTMGFDFEPTTTKGDGYILPRKAEMILNAKYYPTGTVGEWPIDPETGEKLPIKPWEKEVTLAELWYQKKYGTEQGNTEN
jgi:hypothetical protein